MKKKSTTISKSQIRAGLRRIWLRSPERAAALKRDKYTCQVPGCGRKQSKAKGKEIKVQVHHLEGILDWEFLLKFIMSSGLFCSSEHLTTMCAECHKKEKVKKKEDEK